LVCYRSENSAEIRLRIQREREQQYTQDRPEHARSCSPSRFKRDGFHRYTPIYPSNATQFITRTGRETLNGPSLAEGVNTKLGVSVSPYWVEVNTIFSNCQLPFR
jgi:hypothetical protein